MMIIDIINEVISVNKKLIEQLDLLLNTSENISGTATKRKIGSAVLGILGVVAMPFTAGISLAVAGTVAGVGTAAYIGSSITEQNDNKKIIEELKKKVTEKENKTKSLNKKAKEIKSIFESSEYSEKQKNEILRGVEYGKFFEDLVNNNFFDAGWKQLLWGKWTSYSELIMEINKLKRETQIDLDKLKKIKEKHFPKKL